MKARVDHGCNSKTYKNLLHGLPVQEKMAKELHQLSSVPEGPCGIPKLEKFQPALPGYQIKDISVNPPHCIIFLAKTPSDKLIPLIKEDGHYNGCKSSKGFLSKSQFCHECDKGYNDDAIRHHPRNGKWCPPCHCKECHDSIDAKRSLGLDKFPKPQSLCLACHRWFYGNDCYTYHLFRQRKQ